MPGLAASRKFLALPQSALWRKNLPCPSLTVSTITFSLCVCIDKRKPTSTDQKWSQQNGKLHTRVCAFFQLRVILAGGPMHCNETPSCMFNHSSFYTGRFPAPIILIGRIFSRNSWIIWNTSKWLATFSMQMVFATIRQRPGCWWDRRLLMLTTRWRELPADWGRRRGYSTGTLSSQKGPARADISIHYCSKN